MNWVALNRAVFGVCLAVAMRGCINHEPGEVCIPAPVEAPAPPPPPPLQTAPAWIGKPPAYWHDDGRGVTCWILDFGYGGGGNSMSCLKDDNANASIYVGHRENGLPQGELK